jgi:hypothetical protein
LQITNSLICIHKIFITFVSKLIKFMRPRQTLTFIRKTTLILLGILFTVVSIAQEATNKWSASVALGVPVTFFSIKSKPIGIYTGAARYSFNKTWSLEARVTANTFYNNATGNSAKTTLDGTSTDVLSYRTPVYGLNGIVYYNLHNIFGLNKFPESKWLPYASLGAGYNWYKPSVTYANGASATATEFGKPYRDFQLGIGTRYFINSNLDLFGGLEYHISETYYLDGFREKVDPSLDQFMNLYAGVSVKFGAKPYNNLVDWNHKNIEKVEESTKLYSKWAVDGTIGLPYLFTPVGYNLTGMAGLGLRRSFTSSMAMQVNFIGGRVSGSQDISGTPAIGSPEAVKEFSTKIRQFTVRALFNMRNLGGEPSNRREWNHYAILGAGYTKAFGDATFANGNSNTEAALSQAPGIQTLVVGYETRKYLTHNFDLIAGIDFAYNQSKWLDQAGAKSNLNNNLYIHTGVTYKIGTNKDVEHMDWAYANYNNFKDKRTVLEQVPVIEKPVTQAPKIETPVVVEEPKPAPVVEPVVAPVVAAPVVEPAPVAVTPVPEPKPAPAPVAVTPTPAPKPAPAPKPVPTPVVAPAPKSAPAPYVATDDVTPPPSKYNVIVACYSVNKLNIARLNQKVLAGKGYSPSIYKSSTNSKMLRMSVISTEDKAEAIKTLRKARKEVAADSWLYIYNAQ